jgi:hypothetical protein
MTETVLGVSAEARVDWANLLLRVRSGDICAREELRALIRNGIDLLVRRRVPEVKRPVAAEQAIATVLRQVGDGLVQTEQEYAAAARQAVIDAAGTHTAPPKSAPVPALHAITEDLSDMERDMLRRYYVLRQEPEQICATLHVPLERFSRARACFRSRMG